MKKQFLLLLSVCFSWNLIAQTNIQELDSVTITTKIPSNKKNIGKISVDITHEMIENSRGKSVAQILNYVAGIEINGSRSSAGQNLGYFVRGGRNRQVVIMIDGIQVTDPSDISNGFDLRLIPTTAIDRIEIIKGAASVLYGSGAGAAVINIIMKPASKKAISGSLLFSLGSNSAAEKGDSEHTIEEFTSHVSINGTLKKFFYTASFSHKYVDGLSAIAAVDGEERFQADLFNRIDSRINVGYNINKNVTVSRFFALDKFKAGFDDFGYIDAENFSNTKVLRTGGKFKWKFAKGSLVVNDNYSWIDRENNSSYPTRYDSNSFTLDSYITYKLIKGLSVLTGLNINTSSFNAYSIPFGATEFSQDISEEDAKFEILDPYLNVVYNTDFGFSFIAGLRLNNHSNYDSHLVYSINPSYTYEFNAHYVRAFGSVSTAYITPSLYQLYDPLYGNDLLIPEDNTTREVGIEYVNENDFMVNIVFFSRKEKNFVDFILIDPDQYIYEYQNTMDQFKTSGFEVGLSKKVGKKLHVNVNYTNTQADESFKFRIPEHKANAHVRCQMSPNTSFGFSYQYNSDRLDNFFDPTTFQNERVTLASYQLLDFDISSKVTKNLRLFVNVNNILNEEYEEIYRYQTLGRNIRAGISLEF